MSGHEASGSKNPTPFRVGVSSTTIGDDYTKRRQRDFIDSQTEDLKKRIAGAWTLVALLGAGGKGLEERRSIARDLHEMGIGALIPEDDLPEGLAPSLLERHFLSTEDVDLIFVNAQSWGQALWGRVKGRLWGGSFWGYGYFYMSAGSTTAEAVR